MKRDGKEYTNKGIAARGQLHDETVFGKRKDKEGREFFHVRKPLQNLTAASIPKIVDERILQLANQRLQEVGLLINEKNGKPEVKTKEEKEAFSRAFAEPLFLPNKQGDPVPVRKVRIRENYTKAVQLKEGKNQWVNPGSNHHVLIYRDYAGQLDEQVVTFWEAVERKRQGHPLYQLPEKGKEIVATLQINDMFLLGLHDDELDWEDEALLNKHLYRVQKLSSKFYEFRHHCEATIENSFDPYYHRINGFGEGKTGWLKYNPIKVFVSRTGKLSPVDL